MKCRLPHIHGIKVPQSKAFVTLKEAWVRGKKDRKKAA
jgi:hypothetical protein